jgi:Ni/Fe-hydrogenase subunit HybB-like protein
MSARRHVLKTVLWAIMGVLAVVTVVRFVRGLGATTALTDVTPWGFWIAFDVMAGVALAAGGFVLAATFYIFHLDRYHPFTRPAILTAFLGYAAVAVGLTYDLGLPWHILNPIFHPQLRSVLFEVAACVMLYLTVLSLEFSPVVLEHRWFGRPPFTAVYALLKKATIPLVIMGIVLSSLHQSSLGSLFLIAPYRLHPLWYSPIIWVHFLASAVGLGLMMVTAESFFSAWLFGHRLRMKELSGLGKAGAVVLFLYAVLRIGDLAVRGTLGAAFEGSWQGNLFLFEMTLGALLPAALLAFRAVRQSAAGLATASAMTILGMIGYRFDVCIVAFRRPEGLSYFPSWMEVAVSLGIVAGAMLVFIFFVERLEVYPAEHECGKPGEGTGSAPGPGCDPGTVRALLPLSLAAPRFYSIAFVGAAAVAIGVAWGGAVGSDQSVRTPVQASRTLIGAVGPRDAGKLRDVQVLPKDASISAGHQRIPLLVIDGNRDDRLVLFPHDLHAARLGHNESCTRCHHENEPFDSNTTCDKCHADMYLTTDVFKHSSHTAKLGGVKGCARCHKDTGQVKGRDTAAACETCHAEMVAPGSFVRPKGGTLKGYAVGYMDAMHGLCLECHRQSARDSPGEFGPDFARCAACHRESDAARLRGMGPYAEMGGSSRSDPRK